MQHPSQEQALLLTVNQVMRRLQLGRSKLYQLINREGLPVQRFGRAVRISATDLDQWLNERKNNLK